MAYRNDNEEYYMETWKRLLGVFLGWSDLQVIEWAAWCVEYMGDPLDLLYHAPPHYWVRSLFVDQTVRNRLSHDGQLDLDSRLVAAFDDEHRFDFPLDTDWRPYKAKVEDILSEYGAHLPMQTEP